MTVFDVGAEYARRLGAELYLFRTVTVPPHFPLASAGVVDDPLPRRLAEIAEHDLNLIAKRAPDIAVAETLVTFGLPGQMILETADKLKADLIVLGGHGHHNGVRILGTTAATIANHSSRNVLVVHADSANGIRETGQIHSGL
jgi:nucleotide-binding universal stress UspA family protein